MTPADVAAFTDLVTAFSQGWVIGLALVALLVVVGRG